MTVDPTAYAYDVAVLAQDGTLLHVPRGSLSLEEQKDEMSATARCSFPYVETSHGHMSTLVLPGTPLYVYIVERGPTGNASSEWAVSSVAGGAPWDPGWAGAEIGFGGGASGRKEIFRGTIVEYARSTDGIDIQVMAHDVLHVMLNHEVDATIEEGTEFSAALARLAEAWGLTLGRVDGPNATLPEMTWRGEPCSTVLADMLEAALINDGGHYVMRATGDELEIVKPGTNEPIYELVESGGGAGVTSMSVSIAELVGGVKVMSTFEDPGKWVNPDDPEGQTEQPKPPTSHLFKEMQSGAGFNGATKTIYLDKASSPEAAELEAQIELARNGFPQWAFDHTAIDIPGVRRYDKIAINDDILGDAAPLYILAVTHNCSEGTMAMTLQTETDYERENDAARLEAQLARLRGQEEDVLNKAQAFGKGAKSTSGDPWQRILAAAGPVMDTPYVWGGPGGRTNFDPDQCHSDCSGFVNWLCHQLRAPTGVYAFTDNLAQVSQLVATNSTNGAVAGDFVLQKDPSVQAGATYYHVQMYSGHGSTVIEDGGTSASSGGSRIWVGSIISGYEIRRFPPLYQQLHGANIKEAEKAAKKKALVLA